MTGDDIHSQRVAEILDGFGEAYVAFDFEWRPVHINTAAEAHFGFRSEDVGDQTIWDLVPGRGGDLHRFLTEVMSTRVAAETEVNSDVHPGRRLTMRAFPVDFGIGVGFRDITVKVGLERALRESEARFRAMADSAPAPIWVTNAAGAVEFVNRAFRDLSGKPLEQLLGDSWVGLMHPDDAPAVGRARAEARPTFAGYEWIARFLRYDGQWRWIHATLQPRFEESGAFQGYVGLAIDVTENRKADQRQKLLIHELNHRVKNTLATIQSLAHQTLREGVVSREARAKLTDRLLALSAAHNVLTRQNWEAGEIGEIVREAVGPYCDLSSNRVHIDGPSVQLAPNAALAMAMALHELATNAVKYGALSVLSGEVFVAWTVTDDAMALEWREADGPAVREPPRHGFGSRLLQEGLIAELGAPAQLTFEASGLICRIKAPLERAPHAPHMLAADQF